MGLGASLSELPPGRQRGRGATAWAAVIAVLFAAVAAVSFAIDQTVTLSSPPAAPVASSARR